MTAEPAGRVLWSPDPVRQRLADHTVEDVLDLPDDAPRVELRDGVMIVATAPTLGHQQLGNLLWWWLRRHAPATFEAATGLGVMVGFEDTFEPDVLLLRRPVEQRNQFFTPDQVPLVVEVVCRGTERRDRLARPAQYAAAGIAHYWRIEQDPVRVFAYDLVDGRYELAADAADVLRLTAPFAIELPISDITP